MRLFANAIAIFSALLLAPNARGQVHEPMEVVLTPTPIVKGQARNLEAGRGPNELIDPSARERQREFLVQHYAEQGIEHDPGKVGEQEDLSPQEWERRYGPKVAHQELPPDEKLTGCLYTSGVTEPDVCFGDRGEEIYNEQRDDPSVLEGIKRAQGKK